MDKDFPAALIPIGVICAGFDICNPTHPMFSLITTFLAQNGF